jgi:hypothetical protein
MRRVGKISEHAILICDRITHSINNDNGRVIDLVGITVIDRNIDGICQCIQVSDAEYAELREVYGLRIHKRKCENGE